MGNRDRQRKEPKKPKQPKKPTPLQEWGVCPNIAAAHDVSFGGTLACR